jgi:hypothetical protein
VFALVVEGSGLCLGVLGGPAPLALTLAPAFGVTALSVGLALSHECTRIWRSAQVDGRDGAARARR